MSGTSFLHQWRLRAAVGFGGLALLVSGATFAWQGPEDAGAGSGDTAEQLRQRVEMGMGEIVALEEDAQKNAKKEFAQIACVTDKKDQAELVLELATGEILIIRDPTAGAEAQQFALEKLEAAAERMELLADEARNCGLSADRAQEEDKARTDQDRQPTIPMEDPSSGMGVDPVPPVIDGSWPPTASGSE